jgi:hypothetical protein
MTEQRKRPRGRPRLIPVDGIQALRAQRPDVHTDRGVQNLAMAHQAMRILGLLPETPDAPSPPATWLVDWDGADRGRQGAIKWAILEQLGRMAYVGFGEDFLRSMATPLEQRHPSVKEGAMLLRGVRLTQLRKARASAPAP